MSENNDLSVLCDKLREKEEQFNQKLRFCIEHKFEKEADYLRAKAAIVREIRLEVKDVAESRKEAKDIDFKYIE